jgi:hypothetical protein
LFTYKDFAPEVVEKGGLFRSNKVEALKEVVATANHWAETNSVEVINIETVLLPVTSKDPAESFERTAITVELGMAEWTQIIRVWFREG